MSVTLAVSQRITWIPGLGIYAYNIIASANGDASGGTVSVDVPMLVQANDEVYLSEVRVRQDSADTETHQAYVQNTEWSGLNNGSASGWMLSFVPSGGWNLIGTTYRDKREIKFDGISLGRKLVDAPVLHVEYGANADAKVFMTTVNGFIRRY